MTATLTFDEAGFLSSCMADLNKAKIPCQAAMADAFGNAVFENMASAGNEDSSVDWEQLRYMYAQYNHGGDRTPHLVLSGKLQQSIINGIDVSQADAAIVSTDCPYAITHQEGKRVVFKGKSYDIPPRPFFPIEGGDVLPKTAQKCVDACEQALIERLR